MGYSRLLRKVAERVLRDITIIIFRRFSSSTSLMELNQQHIQQHKLTGMQFKIQRGMSMHSVTSTPKTDASDLSSPTVKTTSPVDIAPSWDTAALRIITFLMLAMRPSVPPVMLAEIIRILSFFVGVMRVELKLQIEMFFQRIVFWSLEGNSKNPSLVPLVLDMLIDLSYDPTFLVDLYVNYDCDSQRCDVLETLYKLVGAECAADV